MAKRHLARAKQEFLPLLGIRLGGSRFGLLAVSSRLLGQNDDAFAGSLQVQFGPGFLFFVGVSLVILQFVVQLVFLILQSLDLLLQRSNLMIKLDVVTDNTDQRNGQIDGDGDGDKVAGRWPAVFRYHAYDFTPTFRIYHLGRDDDGEKLANFAATRF